ncbi:MAG: Biopolymer transport protein ExbD [Chlamydiia bacterium]|nr:Biopolymer transport protein ExbD [Chlamydiia bacterium]MCH9616301.1 Biopolymer transport protein ExbD [Chlamydiia bacterium]MCH9629713.1 Biopolymer transport protein ExbD [Chlamydiia bacterium]
MRRDFVEDTADEGLLNLTPLIDVVFVILVMFILIAPMIEIDRITLADGPHVEKSAPNHQKSLTIHVRADNTILINHDVIPTKELESTIKLMKETYPNATPQLFQDKAAQFGTYQTVKNALERSGFTTLDVILNHD